VRWLQKVGAPREGVPALVSANLRKLPVSIVIVGEEGAALGAADMLRREGYDGSVTMISADNFASHDLPNLSKEYLAGTYLRTLVPLRSLEYKVTSGRFGVALGRLPL
jgi:apoptosis-inducing factor 3